MNYKNGDTLDVKIINIKPYGIFVKIDETYNGLIHISEISSKYIKDINEIYKIDDTVAAQIININQEKKQIELSIKKTNQTNKQYETETGFKTLKKNIEYWTEKEIDRLDNSNRK